MKTRKDPAVRKQEIIQASTELFMEHGYERTTVDHILNRLGVARGCFYHYFESKDEVFEACIADRTQALLASYLSILDDASISPKQRLMAYVDYNFQLAGRQRDMVETIHSEGFEAMHERIVKASVRQVMPVFIRLVEQGQASGEFKVLNAAFSAEALMGSFRQIHEDYAGQTEPALSELRELTIDLMERLLQTRFR